MRCRTRPGARRPWGWLMLGAVLSCPLTGTVAEAKAAGYEYFAAGDPAAQVVPKTSPGLLLMGGGREIDDAFKWFAVQAGHGHIVILRASGGDALQEYLYHDVGGVASVETLVFHSRAAAGDPHVLAVVRHADGIFIAGGDQANYVNFWKGTPLNDALNAHVRAGKPIGGTSAGLAILGQWSYGALDGGSITSEQALRDPDGAAVTLVDRFLDLPLLAHTITDTHFAQRGRLGRLLAFVARLAKAQHTAAICGLGVDQDSALLVDPDGEARLLSRDSEGHAWVVIPERLREVERAGGREALDRYLRDRVAPGKPLDLPGFVVIGVGTRSGLRLPSCAVSGAAFRRRIDVHGGRLVGHDTLPATTGGASGAGPGPASGDHPGFSMRGAW